MARSNERKEVTGSQNKTKQQQLPQAALFYSFQKGIQNHHIDEHWEPILWSEVCEKSRRSLASSVKENNNKRSRNGADSRATKVNTCDLDKRRGRLACWQLPSHCCEHVFGHSEPCLSERRPEHVEQVNAFSHNFHTLRVAVSESGLERRVLICYSEDDPHCGLGAGVCFSPVWIQRSKLRE